MNTIQYPSVQNTLNQLHHEASRDMGNVMRGMAKAVFRKLQPSDLKHAYIAISPEQGQFVYDLLIKNNSKHIVEFGTSFGISALYLGAAAKKNGGKVITTEILPSKCEVAYRNFEKAGLNDVIELRLGDALETLKNVEDDIDFVLLDGWKDLYLPLLKMLEPKLKKGAIIYTDNANMASAQPFLDYVRNSNKYQSRYMHHHGAELSEFLG